MTYIAVGPCNFEHCLRRADNVPIWVLENATLIESNQNAPAVI